MGRRSKEEVLYVAGHRPTTVQDHVALVEIDLTGELMIAAAAASEDRLSPDRIDEVLEVDGEGGDGVDRVPRGAGPARRCPG
ncbi:hypothetical protein [Streptomyces sp. NPDC054765]